MDGKIPGCIARGGLFACCVGVDENGGDENDGGGGGDGGWHPNSWKEPEKVDKNLPFPSLSLLSAIDGAFDISQLGNRTQIDE